MNEYTAYEKNLLYKGVIVSISNTTSIITLALPKSDNNNNNNIEYMLTYYELTPTTPIQHTNTTRWLAHTHTHTHTHR